MILAAHTAAWQTVTVPPEDPRRLVESVQDPLRRALLAVTIPRLRRAWRGELLCSALAALPTADAEILGWHLLPRLLTRPLMPAFAVETVAAIVQKVADGGHVVRGWGAAQEWIRLVCERIAASSLIDRDAEYVFAVMVRTAPPSVGMTGATAQHSSEHRLDGLFQVWRTCGTTLGSLAHDTEPARAASQEAA